jgi:hypothetical protein
LLSEYFCYIQCPWKSAVNWRVYSKNKRRKEYYIILCKVWQIWLKIHHTVSVAQLYVPRGNCLQPYFLNLPLNVDILVTFLSSCLCCFHWFHTVKAVYWLWHKPNKQVKYYGWEVSTASYLGGLGLGIKEPLCYNT